MTITFSYDDIHQIEKKDSDETTRILTKITKEEWNNTPLSLEQLNNFAIDYGNLSTLTDQWLLNVFLKTNKIKFDKKLNILISCFDFLLSKTFIDGTEDYGLFEMRNLLAAHLNNSDSIDVFIIYLNNKIADQQSLLDERGITSNNEFQNKMMEFCIRCTKAIADIVINNNKETNTIKNLINDLQAIAIYGIHTYPRDTEGLIVEFYDNITTAMIRQ